MYKKILITILSLLCLCSNPVYADDVIEQPTENLTENAEIAQDAPTETIDGTNNIIEDDTNTDDSVTDTTQDEIEEPKEDSVTRDEGGNATDETLNDNQENIDIEEEISNDKIADEENTEVAAIEKATITFNSNGGVLNNKALTVTKNIGDTYGMLSGEGKHFESSKDNENLGYANYDFGNKITISTKIKFDKFSYQEWFGNWESAGFGLGCDPQRNSLYLSVNTNGGYKVMYIPNTLNINEEHWITAVYDAPSDKMQIYIDGILQSGELSLEGENNPTKGSIKVSKAPFVLGCNPDLWTDGSINLSSAQFHGSIYKAGLWTKALTDDEIKDMVENDYIKSDALINLDYAPIKEGYTFLGWYDEDGNKASSNTIVTRDMTLTARWQQAYEWSVPSEIVFANNSNTDSQKQSVSITNNNNNAKMRISLSSNNNFELTNNEGVKKCFKIYKDNEELKPNDVVLTNPNKNGTTTQVLNFELQPSDIEYAGNYKGQVNFIIDTYYEAKDAIEIEGNEYTVIENIEGSKYKVLGQELAIMSFNEDPNIVEYNETQVANYLDNDYYNSLSENIKKAIVEKEITQTTYLPESFIKNNKWQEINEVPTSGETGWWLFNYKEIDNKMVGKHKVFIPSVKEFNQIVDINDSLEVWNYMEQKNSSNIRMWLRDITETKAVIYVYHDTSSLSSCQANMADMATITPAMVLDLSKVNYTVK